MYKSVDNGKIKWFLFLHIYIYIYFFALRNEKNINFKNKMFKKLKMRRKYLKNFKNLIKKKIFII